MNDTILLRLAALVATAALLVDGGDVRAADPAAAPPASTSPAAPATNPSAPATPATTPATTPSTPAAGRDAPKDPGVGAKPGDAKGSPLHFEPTEKTRADFEVSFPSDI